MAADETGVGRGDLGRHPGEDDHEEQELQATRRHAQNDMAACRQDDRRAKHEVRVCWCGCAHATCLSCRLMASRSVEAEASSLSINAGSSLVPPNTACRKTP